MEKVVEVGARGTESGLIQGVVDAVTTGHKLLTTNEYAQKSYLEADDQKIAKFVADKVEIILNKQTFGPNYSFSIVRAHVMKYETAVPIYWKHYVILFKVKSIPITAAILTQISERNSTKDCYYYNLDEPETERDLVNFTFEVLLTGETIIKRHTDDIELLLSAIQSKTFHDLENHEKIYMMKLFLMMVNNSRSEQVNFCEKDGVGLTFNDNYSNVVNPGNLIPSNAFEEYSSLFDYSKNPKSMEMFIRDRFVSNYVKFGGESSDNIQSENDESKLDDSQPQKSDEDYFTIEDPDKIIYDERLRVGSTSSKIQDEEKEAANTENAPRGKLSFSDGRVLNADDYRNPKVQEAYRNFLANLLCTKVLKVIAKFFERYCSWGNNPTTKEKRIQFAVSSTIRGNIGSIYYCQLVSTLRIEKVISDNFRFFRRLQMHQYLTFFQFIKCSPSILFSLMYAELVIKANVGDKSKIFVEKVFSGKLSLQEVMTIINAYLTNYPEVCDYDIVLYSSPDFDMMQRYNVWKSKIVKNSFEYFEVTNGNIRWTPKPTLPENCDYDFVNPARIEVF